MKSFLRNLRHSFHNKADKRDVHKITQQIDELRFSLGVSEIKRASGESFNDFELKVFSQFGEDGLINFILERINLPPHLNTFIEFGVEDYRESNTRFLMEYRNWSGLVIDGNPNNVDKIKNHHKWWKFDLKAIAQFIDKDNINDIIDEAGFSGEIGLLSVDIDGNDYWVWESIEIIQPQVLVIEYNSHFGSERAVTIPYSQDFQRVKSGEITSYFGASISAFEYESKKKGFTLIGSNNAGNNIFFVAKKYAHLFVEKCSSECWRPAKFRETRDHK